MTLIQPWKIEILHINLLDRVDNDQIAQELHNLHCVCPFDQAALSIVDEKEFPTLVHFRDIVLSPIVKDYIRNSFNVEPVDLVIDTGVKVFAPGEGLDAHLHGNSNLTAVYYPNTSNASMVLFDPRFNASRGYPQEVRDGHFGKYYVHPKEGDLWLMPSYIMHSVEPNDEGVRFSLRNEFFFKA